MRDMLKLHPMFLFDPFDSSNPRLCICDTTPFPINFPNGCNNDNNYRCFNHNIVTCNSVKCDKVFNFVCIGNPLHDAKTINIDDDIRNTY